MANITIENCYGRMPKLVSDAINNNIDASKLIDMCLALCSIDVDEGTNSKEMRVNRFYVGDTIWTSVLDILDVCEEVDQSTPSLPMIQQMRLVSSAIALVMVCSDMKSVSPVTLTGAEKIASLLNVNVIPSKDYANQQEMVDAFNALDDAFNSTMPVPKDDFINQLNLMGITYSIFDDIRYINETSHCRFIALDDIGKYVKSNLECKVGVSGLDIIQIEHNKNASALLREFFPRNKPAVKKLRDVIPEYYIEFYDVMFAAFYKIVDTCYKVSKTYTLSILQNESTKDYFPVGRGNYTHRSKYSILNVVIGGMFDNNSISAETVTAMLRIESRLVNGSAKSYESIKQEILEGMR